MPFRFALRHAIAASTLLASAACSASAPTYKPTDAGSPLALDRVIPLADTRGRIDHLAIDLPDQRLFVAEVANGTVDVIDLKTGKVVNRIQGLKGPQGVAWLSRPGELVIAAVMAKRSMAPTASPTPIPDGYQKADDR